MSRMSQVRRALVSAAVVAAAAATLGACGSDPCEEAYDALWMTRLHTDGTKTCIMIGEPGDSAYGYGELPYPG